MTVTAVAYRSGYALSWSASASFAYTTPTPAAVYVQQCTGYQQYGNSTSCTFTSPSTAGDTILIAATQTTSGDTITSVTSNIGTPTLVTSNSGTGNTLYAYALTNIASGTYTITATASSGTSRMWIAADEFTDVPTSPIDASANGYNPGNYVSSVVSGNFNTTQASDMLWAACFANAYMNAGNAPIPWTLLPQDTLGSGGNMTLEDGVAGPQERITASAPAAAFRGQIVTVALLELHRQHQRPASVRGRNLHFSSVGHHQLLGAFGVLLLHHRWNRADHQLQSLFDPVSVASSQTLKAITVATGYSPSTIGSAAYTINLPPASSPTFSPVAGNYATTQTVTISDTTPSATIYYTTDGSTPTTGSTLYTAPISVSATTETVNAAAIAPSYTLSPAATAVYTIGNPVATPTFSPTAGTFTTIQTVTISDTTPSSTIYYTTNGSTPNTNSSTYGGAITVSSTETINAIATAAGYVQSNQASAVYTINLPTAATPFFSPLAGTYGAAQSVVIATTTPSASIYYTTNGTTPTTGSTLYSVAVSVAATGTLEAIATATGYSNSTVGSSAYTISAGGGSAPTYVQECNAYYNNNTGTMNCQLTGVGAGHALVIGYWNGAYAPTSVTATTGTPALVTSVIPSGSSTSYLSAYLLSNVTSGTYTITANFSNAGYTKGGLSVIEYSNVATSPLDTSASVAETAYTSNAQTPNYTTTSANDMLWVMCDSNGTTPVVGTVPITWTAVTGPTGSGANILVADGAAGAAGTYYGYCKTFNGQGPIASLALFGASTPVVAAPTFSPGSETYTSVQTVTISDATPSASIYYTTNGTAPTTASTLYTTPVTVSSTETLIAKGYYTGDTASPLGYAYYVINLPQAATPSFSPVAGSFTSVQTVTISDTTPSATIYYTTNGSAPTTASSLFGSSPISVPISSTETLEAIAVATNYSNSAVQSGVYSIILPAATPTFSPVAGSYSTVQTVTISDTTPSSTIYYTTTGIAPTTASSVYSGPVRVPAPETLEAVAISSSTSLSPVGSAVYTYPIPAAGASYVQQCNAYVHNSGGTTNSCQLTGITAGDTIVIGIWTTAATLTSVTATTGTPTVEISDYASTQQYYSNGYTSAYILPNAAAGSNTFTVNTPSDYTDSFIQAVEFSGVAASPYDVQGTGTLHNYTADVYGASSTFSTTAANDMLWTMCEYSAGTTLAVGNVPITWTSITNLAENSANILTEYGSAGAAGSYYGDCEKIPAGYGPDIVSLALKTAVATASTPTFSPVAGSYPTAQSVTISTTTPSATIYYTTDGTTPTTSLDGLLHRHYCCRMRDRECHRCFHWICQ